MLKPEWVRQEDQHGCAIATLAMITGQTYSVVKEALKFDGTLASTCEATQKEWLLSQGWESEICYFLVAQYDLREDFIPKDRPYYLWLSVGDGNWRHSVLQLMDGTILDPEHPEPRSIGDYKVQMITVVFRSENET